MSHLTKVAARQNKVDKSNIDRSISEQKAYEFLLRTQEAKEWIEDMIDEKLPPGTANFMDHLHNGVVLCSLANAFLPGSVTKIHKPKIGSVLEFMATDNYNQFFRACDKVNFPKIYMFETTDLWEKKNMYKIVHCIHTLAHYLFTKGYVKDKRIKRLKNFDFDPEEIQKTKKELEKLDEMPTWTTPVDDEDDQEVAEEPVEEEEPEEDLPPEDNLDDELADPDKCAIVKGEPRKARAGEKQVFVLQAKDASGNDIKQGGERFSAFVIPKDESGSNKITLDVKDLANGLYEFTYTPTRSGEYTQEVSLIDEVDGEQELLPVTNACVSVQISPATPDHTKCEVSGMGAESAIAGVPGTFQIVTRDQFGNKCSGGDKFTATLTHKTKDSVSVSATVIDEGNGSYSFAYTCPISGDYQLNIQLNETTLADKSVVVKDAGVSDPKNCQVHLPENLNQLKAGDSVYFTFKAYDKHGNARSSGGENFVVEWVDEQGQLTEVPVTDKNDGSYEVQFTPERSGNFELRVSLQGKNLPNTPARVFVADAGSTDPAKCTSRIQVASQPPQPDQDPLQHIRAGEPVQVHVEARDCYGNKRPTLNDNESFVLLLVSKGKKEQVAQVEVTAKDVQSETQSFVMPFTLTESDEYALQVLLSVQGAEQAVNIPSFPCDIRVIESGKTEANKTRFEGDGLTRAVSNQATTFTIITHDAYGNRRTTGGDQIQVVLVNPKRNVTFTAEVTDLEDGSYEVNYLPTTSGQYQVQVTINGQAVETEQLPKGAMHLLVEAPYVKKITKEDLESIYDHDLLSSLMNSFIVEQDNENLIEEIQKVREQLVKQIRSNTQVESDVKELDRKIQLLVNNRLAVESILNSPKGLFGLFRNKKQAGDKSAGDNKDDNPIKDPKKMELYSKMFYLLQTDPRYLSQCLYLVPAEKVDKFLETVILTLYGYAFSPREEFLILNLFKNTLHLEISKSKKLGSFLNNNPVLPKMVMTYGRRVQGKNFLQKVLFDKILNNILGDKELNLELNAVKLLRDHISAEEVRTGVKSKVNLRDLTFDKAMEDEVVSKMVNERVEKLTELCQAVLDGIIEHVNEIPYGLRWVCKQLDQLLKQKHPDSNESERASVIGYIVYYRFMNPAIVSPDFFGLTKKNQKISMNMRNNLVIISKVLTNLTNNVLFDPKIEAQMTVMNEWLKKNQKVYVDKFIRGLIQVEEPEETLGVHQFMELTQKKAPSITITWNELFSTHALLHKYMAKLVTESNDPLKQILDGLGSQVPEEVAPDRNEEINLPLIPMTVKDVEKAQEVTPEQLYEQAKHHLRHVLRSLPADSLGENLEETLQRAKQYTQDKLSSTPSGEEQAKLQTTLGKIKALEDALPKLEQAEIVSRANHYRKILVDITDEIQNQKVIREKQRKELERLKESLKSLEEHQKYLKDRIVQFEEYIEDCRRRHFQGSSSKGGSNAANAAVSRKKKYTFKQLKDKGVIVDLNVMKSQQGKISFVISMSSPGQFQVEAKLLGMTVKTIQLILDDLLDRQSKGIQTMQFDNVVLDVNMTLHLLNKLFASKH
jgi:hypothetical protein